MVRSFFSLLVVSAAILCSLSGSAFADSAESLDSLMAQMQQTPTGSESSPALARRIENSVSGGLPSELPTGWIVRLPVDAQALPDDSLTLLVPKPFLPTHSSEPQHGWQFAKVTYLYLPGANPAMPLRLFCTVHYTSTEDAALAARVARFLALSHKTLVEETGQEAQNGTEPFDVWLCRGGQTGGEQWRSNLYFYDLETPRSSIEWIREIAHEYSHLALPAIGGYDAPEYWANGYLGERLIVRWLMRAPGGPRAVERNWGDFSGAPNFDRLLLAPAVALYRKVGPSEKWEERRDEAGMRYLIGQALVFDDKYGARRLGNAFARLPHFHSASASDFADALGQSRAASTSP